MKGGRKDVKRRGRGILSPREPHLNQSLKYSIRNFHFKCVNVSDPGFVIEANTESHFRSIHETLLYFEGS